MAKLLRLPRANGPVIWPATTDRNYKISQNRDCEVILPKCYVFQLEVYSQNKNQEKSFDFRLVSEVLLVDCIVNRLYHRWLQKSTILSLYSWLHMVCDISYAI